MAHRLAPSTDGSAFMKLCVPRIAASWLVLAAAAALAAVGGTRGVPMFERRRLR